MKRVKSLPPTEALAGAIAAMGAADTVDEVDDYCEDLVEAALALCVTYDRFEADKRKIARSLRELSIVLEHAAEREELLAPLVHA